ncbi:MAG: DALR domain-containing protein, partial [Gallionella sp.]
LLPSPSGRGTEGEGRGTGGGTEGEGKGAVNWNEPHAQRFKAAMDDDFNTPEAVAVLFDLANEVNKTNVPQLAAQLRALGGTLGLLQRDPTEFLQGSVVEGLSEMQISEQIAARIAVKLSKNYAEADRIRKELLDAGIELEDSASGTTWRRA